MMTPLEERIASARNPPPGEFGPFSESVRLVLEMHRHALQGTDESSHADALRDQMTTPWHAMTDEERAVLNKLSAALRRDEEGRRRTRQVGTRLVPTQAGGEGDGR